MHQMKNLELSNKIIKMRMYLTANYPQLKKGIVSRKYPQMNRGVGVGGWEIAMVYYSCNCSPRREEKE